MDYNWMIGKPATDKVTAFAGTVTGVVYYLTGCTQALVTPTAEKSHEYPNANWIDVQRLNVDRESATLVLDNSDTNGPDIAPPIR